MLQQHSWIYWLHNIDEKKRSTIQKNPKNLSTKIQKRINLFGVKTNKQKKKKTKTKTKKKNSNHYFPNP